MRQVRRVLRHEGRLLLAAEVEALEQVGEGVAAGGQLRAAPRAPHRHLQRERGRGLGVAQHGPVVRLYHMCLPSTLLQLPPCSSLQVRVGHAVAALPPAAVPVELLVSVGSLLGVVQVQEALGPGPRPVARVGGLLPAVPRLLAAVPRPGARPQPRPRVVALLVVVGVAV